MRKIGFSISSAAVLAVTALFASASASAAPHAGDSLQRRAATLTTVRLATPPLSLAGAVQLGKKKGFFRSRGIDLHVQVLSGGPAITAAITGGSVEVGSQAIVPMLLARSQGINIQLVAPNITVTPNFVAAVVRRDSPIRRPIDLIGKSVAVSSLNGADEIAVREWVWRAGGDPSKINFVFVLTQFMNAALEQGRVDVITPSQPFLTQSLKAGHRYLGYHYSVFGLRQPGLASWGARDEWARQNPGLARRFALAVAQSNRYANSHPKEVKELLPSWTGITLEEARTSVLPVWGNILSQALLRKSADWMLKFKFIESRLDVSGAIWSAAPARRP